MLGMNPSFEIFTTPKSLTFIFLELSYMESLPNVITYQINEKEYIFVMIKTKIDMNPPTNVLV